MSTTNKARNISTILSFAVLVGCAVNGVPNPSVQASLQSVRARAGTGSLYVGNTVAGTCCGQVNTYGLGSTAPSGTLTEGSNEIRKVLIAPSGDLYVLTGANSVLEYKPGAHTPWKTINTGLSEAAEMAVDKLSNLYVGNYSETTSSVVIYAADSSTPSATITLHGELAALAVQDGNLYVAYTKLPAQTVAVYSAVTHKHLRNLPSAYGLPYAFAFDRHGNVYVAYFGLISDSAVVVFGSQGTKAIRTIDEGTFNAGAIALAIDSADNLYVANAVANTVTTYRFGSTKPTRTLSTDVVDPEALAVDTQGNLYVANQPTTGNGWVTVFHHGSSVPKYEITKGLTMPTSLAVDNGN